MGKISRKDLSLAIAQLMPRIIQGVQLDFLVSRPITQTQFFVLVAVHSSGRSMMSVLAKNMHVSMPTISGIVDRLVKAGYAQRLDDPKDRRQVVIKLTSKGESLIKQFQSVIRERWQEVLKSLQAKDVESFYRVVVKIKTALQGDES